MSWLIDRFQAIYTLVFFKRIPVGRFIENGKVFETFQLEPRLAPDSPQRRIFFGVLAIVFFIVAAVFYVHRTTPNIDYDDGDGTPIYQ